MSGHLAIWPFGHLAIWPGHFRYLGCSHKREQTLFDKAIDNYEEVVVDKETITIKMNQKIITAFEGEHSAVGERISMGWWEEA